MIRYAIIKQQLTLPPTLSLTSMFYFFKQRLLSATALVGLLTTLNWGLVLSNPSLAQSISPGTDPSVLAPTGPAPTILSFSGGNQLIKDASNAISSQNYSLAVQKFQQAREVFNQLSVFYQDLAGSFSGIDNKLAAVQRKQALEAAQLRDQATYQLALVHRTQGKAELAVPLLIQIIKSQQPTRDLGKKAYQQLVEIGFIQAPTPPAP